MKLRQPDYYFSSQDPREFIPVFNFLPSLILFVFESIKELKIPGINKDGLI